MVPGFKFIVLSTYLAPQLPFITTEWHYLSKWYDEMFPLNLHSNVFFFCITIEQIYNCLYGFCLILIVYTPKTIKNKFWIFITCGNFFDWIEPQYCLVEVFFCTCTVALQLPKLTSRFSKPLNGRSGELPGCNINESLH